MATRDLKFLLVGQDKSASKTLRKVGKEADRTKSAFSGMVGTFAGGAAAAGIIAFGKSSVHAFTQAQEAQEKLTFAFSKFPKTADISIDALRDYNSALAKTTKFDDDAIATGQAVLAQFNMTGKQIQATTPLLLDYAAATGKDLPTAAETLGRAMMGNAKALKSIGINYKSTGNAAKDFENIQRLVSEKVGGFAKNEGKTAAGQLAILENQFGEVQEAVGERLLPVLTNLGEGLLDTISFVQRNSTAMKVLAVTLGTVGTAVYAVNTAMKVATATSAALTAVQALLTRSTASQGTAAAGAAVSTSALSAAQVRAAITGTTMGTTSVAASGGIRAMGTAAAVAAGPITAVVGLLVGLTAQAIRAERSASNLASTLAGLPTATIGPPTGFDSKGQPTKGGPPKGGPPITFKKPQNQPPKPKAAPERRSGRVVGSNMVGGVTVNINAPVYGVDDFAMTIRNSLKAASARGVKIGLA